MGLIDEVRKRRDSWDHRFEEHRAEEQEYDHEYEKANAQNIKKQIELNCSRVGKFEPLDK